MKQTDLKLIAKEVREVLNVKSLRPARAKLAFITVALAEGYSDKGIANYFRSDLEDTRTLISEAKQLFDLDDDFAEEVRELL